MLWLLVITLIVSAPDSAQGSARTRVEPYASQAACERSKAAVITELRKSPDNATVVIGCTQIRIPVNT